MATQNLVSASIAAATKAQIQTNINAIAAALPFLISLTADERKSGLKLGDKTVAFVDKAIGYANTNAALVPTYINLPEIQQDYQLQKDLLDILKSLLPLVQKIEDTEQEAGAEAYNGILGFYNTVLDATSKGSPGARTIYNDLSQRFPGRKKAVIPASGTKKV